MNVEILQALLFILALPPVVSYGLLRALPVAYNNIPRSNV